MRLGRPEAGGSLLQGWGGIRISGYFFECPHFDWSGGGRARGNGPFGKLHALRMLVDLANPLTFDQLLDDSLHFRA